MNPKLDAALVRDFPVLYRARYADPATTCMARGFEHGDGWEPLVRRLSAKLEELVVGTDARAEQVKEKMGRLRYVMTGRCSDMATAKRLVAEAEAASVTICEFCGAAGSLRAGFPTIRTLCDACLERLARENWRYRKPDAR